MADDEEEGDYGGLYEDGHWEWDDEEGSLEFVSDLPPRPVEAIQLSTKVPTGAVEFRDDVDLIEQVRYRRRYQRKARLGQPDIVTLQDIKDIAIYTAPLSILSPSLIDMLHLPTTERFLRAMILYTAYFLQEADEMAIRILELDTKVKTPICEVLENVFRDNISDLRLLIAKEYSLMLIGGADTKKFHHMGPLKKRRSLSNKDARLYETLLRISVQIVWIALGRRNFNQIEVEINRIFKSDIFNSVEHNLRTGYISKMSETEREVLLGFCLETGKKLQTCSPLLNEVKCHREIDFRLPGLGIVLPLETTTRQRWLWYAIAGNEEDFLKMNVVLGIIGMPRASFDTMLKPVPVATTDKSKATVSSKSAYASASSRGSKKSTTAVARLYPLIVLPTKPTKEFYFPPSFPDKTDTLRPVNENQRRRWQNRLTRMLNPMTPSKSKCRSVTKKK